MICPKCGRMVPDGMPCPCGAPLLSSNPTVNVIKTLGSSPKFLAAAICYSAAVLLGILVSLGSGELVGELYYYGANYGLNPDIFYPMMDVVENTSLLSMVLSAIPSLLIAVGLWLFYATCRSTKSGNISTAGLTICKVLSYISLIALIVAGVFLLILAVLFLVGSSNLSQSFSQGYGYEDHAMMAGLTVLAVLVLVILAAILVLFIALEICVIKTVNRLKVSALNGVPDNRIPRYLTGFLMVLGILNGLGGFVSLFFAPLSGLGSLASAACQILLALLLSNYRNQMNLLVFPPVQPVYPQNVPPYENPPQQPGGSSL